MEVEMADDYCNQCGMNENHCRCSPKTTVTQLVASRAASRIIEAKDETIADLRAQLEQAQADIELAKNENAWLFEQLNGPVVESPVRVLGGWLADELDSDRWAHVEPLLNAASYALQTANATIARQRAWIESAGHRPGCVTLIGKDCGCGDCDYCRFFENGVEGGDVCDCGFAELAGG